MLIVGPYNAMIPSTNCASLRLIHLLLTLMLLRQMNAPLCKSVKLLSAGIAIPWTSPLAEFMLLKMCLECECEWKWPIFAVVWAWPSLETGNILFEHLLCLGREAGSFSGLCFDKSIVLLSERGFAVTGILGLARDFEWTVRTTQEK